MPSKHRAIEIVRRNTLNVLLLKPDVCQITQITRRFSTICNPFNDYGSVRMCSAVHVLSFFSGCNRSPRQLTTHSRFCENRTHTQTQKPRTTDSLRQRVPGTPVWCWCSPQTIMVRVHHSATAPHHYHEYGNANNGRKTCESSNVRTTDNSTG